MCRSKKINKQCYDPHKRVAKSWSMMNVRDLGAGASNVAAFLTDGTTTNTIISGGYTNGKPSWFRGRWDTTASNRFTLVSINSAGVSATDAITLDPTANISLIVQLQSSGSGTYVTGTLTRED